MTSTRTRTRTSARPLGSVLAAAALAVTAACSGSDGTSDVATEEAPRTDPGPSLAAADWLEGQLTDGLMHNPTNGGFDDHGLSLDTAMALDAVGEHQQAVDRIVDAVAADIDAYTTGAAFGSPEDVYASATAKAAAILQARGRDIADVGGTDLLERLEERVAGDGPIAGRIEDSGAEDYANVIGQVFATRALVEAGSDRAQDVTDHLAAQQCEEGFFPLELAPEKQGDQTCDARVDEAPAPDVTALAVVVLEPVADEAGLADALDTAGTWLLEQQAEDGSFEGGTESEGPNANSTGVSGWALGSLGEQEAAGSAAQWLADLQVPDEATDGDALAGAAGAVAYDPEALRAAEQDGITDEAQDQWRRATAQAAPALAWLPGGDPE